VLPSYKSYSIQALHDLITLTQNSTMSYISIGNISISLKYFYDFLHYWDVAGVQQADWKQTIRLTATGHYNTLNTTVQKTKTQT